MNIGATYTKELTPALKGRSDSQGRNSAFKKRTIFKINYGFSFSKPKEGGIIL
jgi:hypothetical protein